MGAWRYILGDIAGRPLASFSGIAKGVSGVDRFIRPSTMRMTVPSDHPEVAGLHDDGDPKLTKMSRTLRAYEPLGPLTPGGPERWAIRFAGVVYHVQDVGDATSAWSTLTAYDPMQRLATRFTGIDEGERVGPGGMLLRQLIADTNALGYTGIALDGYNNVVAATPARTVKYERRNIGDATIELAGSFDGFDPVLRPIHQPPGTEDGTLVALDVHARAGTNRPNSVFAWGMAPNTASQIERTDDGSPLANALTAFGYTPEGGTAVTAQHIDGPSIAKYGRYEAIEQLGDVSNQLFLQALIDEEGALRAAGRELVVVTPNTDDADRQVPRPWHDFEAGDTVPVWAGPALRGGFVGLQRVYGFGYSISDDGATQLETLMTSPDDAN